MPEKSASAPDANPRHASSSHANAGSSDEHALAEFSRGLIDYAGLFPPASLPLPEVIANYSAYVADTANSGMLARLIVPAARLAEFEELAQPKFPKTADGQPWRISALVAPVDAPDKAFDFSISGIRQFNIRHEDPGAGSAVVDAIEIKAGTSEQIFETTNRLRHENLNVFVEIPHHEDPAELINRLTEFNSSGNFFAKIRTGGVTADLIPSCEQVARFIHCCAENLLGMKATAGLHHPLRSEFNLTYEKEAPRATMHGFVNVFAAMCGAFGYGLSESQLIRILASCSPADFQFDCDSLSACGFVMSARRIAAVRRKFAHSFGSCSFDEPRGELNDLVTLVG